MRCLLDTHVVIWAMVGSKKLSGRAGKSAFGLWVGLADGVAEVAFVHMVELVGRGEMHFLDYAAHAFALANTALDFV